MNYTTHYTMEQNYIKQVDIIGNGLHVRIVADWNCYPCHGTEQVDGDYMFQSKDRNETEFVTYDYKMNLPTCLLFAAEFFGLLVPGTVDQETVIALRK
jgi:hypothetical protein